MYGITRTVQRGEGKKYDAIVSAASAFFITRLQIFGCQRNSRRSGSALSEIAWGAISNAASCGRR